MPETEERRVYGQPPIGQKVIVTGVSIPIGELVMLLVKLALAAIPAAIILMIVGAVLFGVLALLGLGVGKLV